MRIGTGYDVHVFKKGRKLVLGGVTIEHSTGLDGHSDADVLVHAIMDAILGAAGMDDIGVHFPDNDISYKDISSLSLLEKVSDLIKKEGFNIVNIDSVLIMEEPKISNYTARMKSNIAEALDIESSQIGIKATTSEGLGFCGKKEGAAAQAVALLESGKSKKISG
ncbi:MAG: 2-C-methyl-D-erythritol 2,4-cyclodiphosphate synthase [Actinobacteria bacterium ADurb.Bin346]|nr:MAG: 2-C-methyl-D-erythritol 2,4-cyclodiphosphate synthase [Actinobacteria bacterium ADurb.Bin346]